ncbi:ABC transporter related [Catenulispora acidiphila DSM 44928]|uniref:ABC transporter related n=1 Tax=Catenulispora acidiphila (strain DSM 44928 / JCM 14897 / NBRC 102108 / NRRL B-24433 / ID139908) TaxID=479433 RepID=C7Q9G3_CATAD|nr:ABC transporter ATP-binding protein [Catenulispora acidiphila]ACU74309.1 ABC transporter related [Catenulispora acidiphila DSM 44928]
MYEISGLTKTYKRGKDTVEALRGVDVVIPDGDLLAIQGPTGHGKSTLLQLIGGLDRPTGGRLVFNGRDMAGMNETQLTKLRARHFGYIFQSFNLIPTLTAQENVETALVPLGVSATERRERAARALADVGLDERRSHLPAELSGGQQQRVAIARALVKEPEVIMADEPTGNLDEETRDEIFALLQSLWRDRGLTVVMVTHDSAIAKRVPHLARIKNGKLSVLREPEVSKLPADTRRLPGTAPVG